MKMEDDPQGFEDKAEMDDIETGHANARDPGDNSGDRDATIRLLDAVKAAGGVTDVARRSGVPAPTLKGFLKEHDVRRSALVALADACGVSVEWLATGRGDKRGLWITARTPGANPTLDGDEHEEVAIGPHMPLAGKQNLTEDAHTALAFGSPEVQIAPVETVMKDFVPIVQASRASALGANPVLISNNQIVDYYAYNQEYIANKLHSRAENLILVEARGDSMHPIIQHGDVLTVDMARSKPLEHAQLYVFSVDSDLVVKRVERRLSGIVLHSENPRYSPEPVANDVVPSLTVLGQVILVSAHPR